MKNTSKEKPIQIIHPHFPPHTHNTLTHMYTGLYAIQDNRIARGVPRDRGYTIGGGFDTHTVRRTTQEIKNLQSPLFILQMSLADRMYARALDKTRLEAPDTRILALAKGAGAQALAHHEREPALWAAVKKPRVGPHPDYVPPSYVTDNVHRSSDTVAAVLALRLAASLIKDTRSAPLALELSGARSLYMAAGSGDHRYQALQEARLERTAGTPRLVCRRKDFLRFKARHFPNRPPTPARVDEVCVYCADWVIDQGNKSSGLGGIASELRCSMRPFMEWGLGETEEAELSANNNYLTRAFPSSSTVPQATLSLHQLADFYAYLERLDTIETRLVGTLMRSLVATQARATELCNGALQEGDLTFHKLGVLIDSVLNKMRKDTLDPTARVAPRLPQHLAIHDPFYHLQQYLRESAVPGDRPDRPVFRDIVNTLGGPPTPSPHPLSAERARELLVRHLTASGVKEAHKAFQFNMHFGRAAGFNMYCNTMHLEKELVAAMGGWKQYDVIDKHYHKKSPLELVSRVFYEQACRKDILGWTLAVDPLRD